MPQDSLTIVDNRTGQEYTLPITDGTIRATDLSRSSSNGSRSRTSTSSQRRLYPNVDFYSGLIYKAMGYSTDYFTVLFALGRLPGWIAQWEEMLNDPEQKISRPRQVYVGSGVREFVPIQERT